jgi:MarR family transcriptional regulator, temperature-dependent positive regulator of motility
MAKDKSESAGPLDRSPSHLLHRALQRALDIYGAAAGPGAITQRQYAVLSAVQAQEGLTQTGLVKSTGIDRSTLADLVARMIAKGLIERERSSLDARANAVRLTESGRAALQEAAPKAAQADDEILRLLPAGKRDAFLSALKSVAEGKPRTAEAATDLEKIQRKRKKDEKKAAKKARKKDKKAAEAVAA